MIMKNWYKLFLLLWAVTGIPYLMFFIIWSEFDVVYVLSAMIVPSVVGGEITIWWFLDMVVIFAPVALLPFGVSRE
jgi:hypothetical protein